MKVKELIAELQKIDPEEEIYTWENDETCPKKIYSVVYKDVAGWGKPKKMGWVIE